MNSRVSQEELNLSNNQSSQLIVGNRNSVESFLTFDNKDETI